MISLYLIKYVLISNFGRNSANPYRTARVRLVLLMLLAGVVGSLMGSSIRRANLPHDLAQGWVFMAITIVSFAVLGLIFISLHSSYTASARTDSQQKIISTLPFTRKRRWLLLILPFGIIWFAVLAFAVPILLAISTALQTPVTGLYAGFLLGSAAALGLALPYIRGDQTSKLVILGLIVLGGSTYVSKLAGVYTSKAAYGMAACMAAIAIGGLWWHYQTFDKQKITHSFERSFITLRSHWLRTFWYGLKLIRNRRTLVSYLFSSALVAMLAIAAQSKNLVAQNSYGWIFIAAVLMSMFASDVRGIARRNKTVEIITLKGYWYFIDRQLVAAFCAACIGSLPLLGIVMCTVKSGRLALLAYYVAVHFAAVLFGLLASAIFVPGSGDTGMQFIASMFAAGCMLLMPKVTGINELISSLQVTAWLMTGIICYVLIACIEQLRRSKYGIA